MTHDLNPVRPRALGHWSVRPLAWDMVLPDIASGFGLLLATRAVRLLHPRREVTLRAGDLALIDRQVPLRITGETGWTARLLELGSRGFGTHADRRNDRIGTALDGTTPLASLIKTLWMVGHEVDRLALADDMIDARMIDLIGDLARKLQANGRNVRMTTHGATMVERAELMIAAHLADPEFSAGTLAACMRVTQRHLSSLFAAAGTTTTRAILAHRLSRAKSLLADPANRHEQIAAIARSSGFDDQNYFARCFRREEGMTPRQFRDGQDNRTNRSDP